jgi:ribosomal protein S13
MAESKIILDFLHTLTKEMEAGNLSEDQLKKISEFMVSFEYEKIESELSEEQLKKYLSLGWYIYRLSSQN